MKQRQKQARNPKSLIATAVIAAVALIYVFFVFLPRQASLAEMRGELEQKQDFVLQVDRLRYSIPSINEEQTLAADFSSQWEERSPSTATLADFYEQLSAAANESRVAITRFDPQPVQELAQICQLPIELATEGTFADVVQFLGRIESFDKTIWLESLAIERLADRPRRSDSSTDESSSTPADGVRVQCQMTLKVFADKNKFSD